MEDLSLYIHIPFCRKRCGYCDFTTYAGMDHMIPEYMDALIKEIELKAENKEISTVFIGGGTPTVLPDDEFRRLLQKVKNLNLTEDAEFTVEANPESLTPEKIRIMKDCGVNRVSMGLQSTDDIILKNIGRIHDYSTFLKAYENTRKVIPNISFDLITALPGQTMEILEDTMDKAIALNPSHISVYSLILEEGTDFFNKVKEGKMVLPQEDEDRDFQDYVRERLIRAGYSRYEISNFSKSGFESRHNIAYWKCRNYIGAGAGASGYEDGTRYTNTRSLREYIELMKTKENAASETSEVTRADAAEEFIFMGMRMNEGISAEEFRRRTGWDLLKKYGNIISKYQNTGHLIFKDDRLSFTDKGMDISNYILSDFME